MKIGVAGAGHVGSTVAAGMVEMGHDVVIFDIDEPTIRSIQADDPNVPEGKDALKSDRVTASVAPGALLDTDIVFLCVPTPSNNGKLDTTSINALVDVLDFDEQTLVIKSTVPPGTCADIDEQTADSVVVGHNPEFLQQGRGLYNFMNNERFVFGGSSIFHEVMDELYSSHPYWTQSTIAHVDWETAEMAKLANNTFLAAKISLSNELASITSAVGGNGRAVMDIVGADSRINSEYTKPGAPWGGDCLPKDVRGLQDVAHKASCVTNMIAAVKFANENVVHRTVSEINNLDGKTVGLLGLSFKPNAESTSQSFARALIPPLHNENYFLYAADRSPHAVKEMKSDFSDVLYDDAQTVVNETEIVVITTAHPEWVTLDYNDVQVIDPANILSGIENYYDLFQ